MQRTCELEANNVTGSAASTSQLPLPHLCDPHFASHSLASYSQPSASHHHNSLLLLFLSPTRRLLFVLLAALTKLQSPSFTLVLASVIRRVPKALSRPLASDWVALSLDKPCVHEPCVHPVQIRPVCRLLWFNICSISMRSYCGML